MFDPGITAVDLSLVGNYLLGAFLLMIRPLIFFRFFTIFETVASNTLVVLVIAIAIMLFQLPVAFDQSFFISLQIDWRLLVLILQEALIGLLLAFTISIPLEIIQSMGQLIDNQRGVMIDGAQNPISHENETPIETIITAFMVLVFFYYDIHLIILEFFFLTIDLVPASEFFSSVDWLPTLGMGAYELYAEIGFKLLPLLLGLLVIDIMAGLLSRRLTSVDATGLSSAIKSIILVFVLIGATPILLDPTNINGFELLLDQIIRDYLS